MKQDTIKQNGHGFFRKSKAYGLVCGIALSALFIGAGTASADELTSPSAPAIEQGAVSTTAPQELVQPVTLPALDQAVATAGEAGVNITTETSPIIYDSFEAAQADLANQVSAIQEATAKQETNTTVIKDATEANAAIDRQNAAEIERVNQVNAQGQAAVEEANRQGQAAVDERNRQGQEAVDRRNQEAWDAYEAEKAALQTSNEDGQAAVDERNRQGQEAVDRRNQERWDAYEAEKAALKTSNEDGQATVDERNRQGQAAVDAYNRDEQARIDAINAELKTKYDAELKAQADVEAHNAGVRERNAQAKAAADAENARLQAEYERQLAEFASKVTEPGHLTEVLVKDLVFESEPNAVMTSRGHQVSTADWLSGDRHVAVGWTNPSSIAYDKGSFKTTTTQGESQFFLVKPGESVEATYTNLENSTYKGKQVGSVKYTFRLTELVGPHAYVGLELFADPAVTSYTHVWHNTHADDQQSSFNWHTDVQFYDLDGQEILPSADDPTLITFASINSGLGLGEYVANFSGDYISINGSAITVKDGKAMNYSGKSIEDHASEVGSPDGSWDAPSSPYAYVGAIGGKATSRISFDFGHTRGFAYWFAFNTRLSVPTPPIPPQPNRVLPEQELPIPPVPAEPNWVTPTFKEFTPEVFVPVTRDIKPPTPEVFVPEVFVPETREIKPPTPEVFTPEVFTPETYTPIEPELLPPVRIPEKETFSAQVRPVVVKVTVTPSKDVVDEAGLSINGQSVLPNSALNYVAKQGFDQYKGITLDSSAIAKNFLYVDDYLDEALDGQSMVTNAITASNGDDVSSLLEMHHVLSQDTLDEKLQALIKESGISPVGEFYLWVAKDPEAFYKAYVQKGLDVTYNLSFKVKDGFVGTVTNQTYQIDFGRGYYGNIVTNDLPPIMVLKTVQDTSGKDINGQTVKLGDELDYTLEGWVIPAGRGYDINEYRFVDMLQVSHDQYRNHRVTAKVAFTLSDGTSFKKGDDLMPYTETVYNSATGQFELRFTQDFLDRVPRSSEFGSDVIVRVKRIASGHVVNEYTNHVNGNPVVSNKVTTDTPEPPAPPVPPTPPVSDTPRLPETGDASSGLAMVTGIMTTVLGLVGLGRKKED